MHYAMHHTSISQILTSELHKARQWVNTDMRSHVALSIHALHYWECTTFLLPHYNYTVHSSSKLSININFCVPYLGVEAVCHNGSWSCWISLQTHMSCRVLLILCIRLAIRSSI